MADVTLMFCVGATKAGTSWLHRYISDHPQCHTRGIKELHYFDAVEFGNYDTWIKDLAERRDANLAKLDRGGVANCDWIHRVAVDAEAWCEVLSRRRADDAAYLDYLMAGRREERLVADITPAYGLLPVSRLAHMARMLPDVRFVYLLRDPVERIWSHARMIASRRATTPDEIQPRSVNILRRILKGRESEIVRRSDYAGTLARLRAAVDPSNLYVAFYEELFTPAAIAGISRFLGIDQGRADFDRRVLQGPKIRMEPGQYAQMREFLAPQYNAMRDMLGRLPEGWNVDTARV